MIRHLFINKLKILLRSKSMIFWTLIFPIVLATFFNLAFSNLTENEKFKPIKIAVINNENYRNEEHFNNLLNELSKSGENQIIELKVIDNEEDAEIELKENNISGYYIVNDKIEMVVNKSGLEETIMKSISDNYYQTQSVINNIYQFNPAEFSLEVIKQITAEGNYLKDKSNTNIDSTVVYFYTLIGMACMYAAFFGMDAANESEANLSKRAARIVVAPIHKLKSLLVSLSVGFAIAFVEILILLLYIVFILKIDFGNQIGWIILLSSVGVFAGITLGVLVGVSNKKSETVKTGILVAVSMTCSFLSGMMMLSIKYIVQEKAPLLAKINPVNMITDALYSLYYYTELNRYFYNIISLVIFSVIMISISYFFVRRKKYDSI